MGKKSRMLHGVFRGQRKTPSCCSRLRLIAQNRDAQQSLADRGIPRGARSVNAFEPTDAPREAKRLVH